MKQTIKRFLSNHIIGGVAGLHKVGDGYAVEKIVCQGIELFPHRERSATRRPFARSCAAGETRNGGEVALGQSQDIPYTVFARFSFEFVPAAFTVLSFNDISRL